MNTRRSLATAPLLALMLLLAAAGAAGAGTISSLSMTGITWGYNLQLSHDGGKTNDWEGVGEMKVHLDLGSGSYQDVIAYCVDIPQPIYVNGTYNNEYSPNPINQTMSTLQAGWLLGHYDPVLGYAHAGYSTAATITALQLAIWEVTYDYSATYASNALDTGNLIAYNVASESTVVRNLANQFLASIPSQLAQLSLTGLGYSGVVRSGTYQDLVVGNAAASGVPEPGSMLLLGSAAGLLGWWRRRRGNAAPDQAGDGI